MRFTSCFVCVFLLLYICFSESAFATNKVYPLDSRYGIIANDDEWICEASTKLNEALGIHNRSGNTTYITGKAKYLPVYFDFFTHSMNWGGLYCQKPNGVSVFKNAKNFLLNYAQKTNTVFSGLNIKSLEEDECFIVTGSYFDNVCNGRFSFYMRPKDTYYCILVKIPGNLLDEQAVEHLFQETFSLITPLIIE